MNDTIGETTWYAYSYTGADGEIEWHELQADGLKEARRICEENGWILDDDDYYVPRMIFW